MADFGKWVIDAFEDLTPDIDGIYNNAKLDDVSEWKTKQKAMVTASGTAAMAIPGAHVVALAADVAYSDE